MPDPIPHDVHANSGIGKGDEPTPGVENSASSRQTVPKQPHAPERCLCALAPMPTVVRGYFVPIATETHAAPMTSVVLGRIIKEEHACRVLTFLDQRQIARAQQVARSLGEQS